MAWPYDGLSGWAWAIFMSLYFALSLFIHLIVLCVSAVARIYDCATELRTETLLCLPLSLSDNAINKWPGSSRAQMEKKIRMINNKTHGMRSLDKVIQLFMRRKFSNVVYCVCWCFFCRSFVAFIMKQKQQQSSYIECDIAVRIYVYELNVCPTPTNLNRIQARVRHTDTDYGRSKRFERSEAKKKQQTSEKKNMPREHAISLTNIPHSDQQQQPNKYGDHVGKLNWC